MQNQPVVGSTTQEATNHSNKNNNNNYNNIASNLSNPSISTPSTIPLNNLNPPINVTEVKYGDLIPRFNAKITNAEQQQLNQQNRTKSNTQQRNASLSPSRYKHRTKSPRAKSPTVSYAANADVSTSTSTAGTNAPMMVNKQPNSPMRYYSSKGRSTSSSPVRSLDSQSAKDSLVLGKRKENWRSSNNTSNSQTQSNNNSNNNNILRNTMIDRNDDRMTNSSEMVNIITPTSINNKAINEQHGAEQQNYTLPTSTASPSSLTTIVGAELNSDSNNNFKRNEYDLENYKKLKNSHNDDDNNETDEHQHTIHTSSSSSSSNIDVVTALSTPYHTSSPTSSSSPSSPSSSSSSSSSTRTSTSQTTEEETEKSKLPHWMKNILQMPFVPRDQRLKLEKSFSQCVLPLTPITANQSVLKLITTNMQPDFPFVDAEMAKTLEAEVVQFYEWIKPTEFEVEKRTLAINEITSIISKLISSVEVGVYGSMATGVFLPSSDIDLVVITQENVEVKLLFERIKAELLEKKMCADENIKIIYSAQVPVIKFLHRYLIPVDISFGTKSYQNNITVINDYLTTYPHLRPIIYFLKHLLHQQHLNIPYQGGLGSYPLIVMVIHFILIYEAKTHNVGELLLRFLHYYGYAFDYQNIGISLSYEGSFFFKKERHWNEIWSPNLLAIEDPVDQANDLGRKAWNIIEIQNLFANVYKIFIDVYGTNTPSLLMHVINDFPRNV